MRGIPYMGSKRKLAKPIIDYILANNPNTKYIYDLFGGGGAISFEALKRKKIQKVHYNELNTGVVELIKKIRDDGVTNEFYQWIDRDTFNKHKDDDNWFGGLVKTCWSFGSNQITYLFSEDNEKIKKPLHNIIVNRCEDSINEFYDLSGLLIDKDLLRANKINQRRLDVMNFVKKNKSERLDLQQLERLQQLQQLERLQQLQQLQQLQRLQRLEQLEQVELSNLSYEDVIIDTPIDETIIYLDPPYKSTAKYQHDIDFEALYSYIRNSPYKIYISSYEMPFFECEQFEHRSTLSATANNKVIERLFCNREEIYLDRLF